ncbi:hypothetical protein [Nitrosopumilus ureiphilus]|uniref:Uncharacterized protein n=1 Tax=Nitrosopumilus ureiphilus TaxID=1470067 RepID=A0A7D5M546_9ARCH|nr:hypothetical protein [Nitrosopumilus ureiphilus]QLH06655.1 hypothetical protein C5F50_05885 [Nitrosopumilus ureiphilus]
MKTNFILLTTTIVFALLTVTFGYGGLLSNYQHLTCWDSCAWEILEGCDEICKDVPEKRTELTREEQKEKGQKLREIYDPILEKYISSIGIMGGPFPRGHGYSYPVSLEDNLDANFDYSDGFFMHSQILEIVSPLKQTDDAGKITIVKEMLFPEMYVFWLFVIAIGIIVGFKIRK